MSEFAAVGVDPAIFLVPAFLKCEIGQFFAEKFRDSFPGFPRKEDRKPDKNEPRLCRFLAIFYTQNAPELSFFCAKNHAKIMLLRANLFAPVRYTRPVCTVL